ncbi:hypothetical protein IEQ34_002794 [Dendrobium chrysotoxum]|uniref:Ribosomal protein S10 n=1 Tax=Dendrobium chrysotoxum TaxID=161865 RepID=A0AAV7HFH0_DENCH|nr:hypothetical protein IEQ34_002794 [Dendrobium chrysotoxum]
MLAIAFGLINTPEGSLDIILLRTRIYSAIELKTSVLALYEYLAHKQRRNNNIRIFYVENPKREKTTGPRPVESVPLLQSQAELRRHLEIRRNFSVVSKSGRIPASGRILVSLGKNSGVTRFPTWFLASRFVPDQDNFSIIYQLPPYFQTSKLHESENTNSTILHWSNRKKLRSKKI